MASFGDLVSSLYDDNDPDMQKDAVVSVVRLALKHANKWETPNFPDALAGIVRLLFKDECSGSQTFAAWALANLSYAHASENKEKMAVFPQVLSGLVRLLSGDGSGENMEPSVQEEAVRALRNLACAQENSHTISLFPGAVASLLKLLFDDSRPGPQTQATMAVLNLMGNAIASLEGISDTANATKLPDSVEFPGVLKCLVGLWFSDASSTVQAQAISAIIDLVERTLVNPDLAAKGGNMQKIAEFPDALLRVLDTYMT